jgi:hypothetical protein
MLTVMEGTRYQRYRAEKATRSRKAAVVHELLLPILLFGGVGALTWAIRGTDGWNGIDGSMVPGLAWAVLWFYLCQRKGIDARSMVLWVGMGVALGGELGYGQYVSWIRGQFEVGEDLIPISPWIGYAWFAICGIAKGITGGIFLGWALHAKVSPGIWLIRVLLVVLLLAILLNLGAPLLGAGLLDWLGERIARHCPWLLFPHADMGLYAGELDKHAGRTVWTNTQNFAVMMWGFLAMLVAALHRDRATLVSGAVVGCGYGIGYAVSTLWCLGYTYAPSYVDWWKIWELHAGFNLGLLFVLAMLWAIRQVDKAHAPDGTPLDAAQEPRKTGVGQEGRTTAFMAFCGFSLVYVMGREYFWRVGLCLALFYVVALVFAAWSADSNDPLNSVNDRRLKVTLSFSVFFLLFRLLQGVTSHGGIVLELYEPGAVDQYAWPAARIKLFIPSAIILISGTLITMKGMLNGSAAAGQKVSRLPERMVDFVTFLGIVAAISIWPAKISALYAMFVCFTVFALTRLNRRFDDIDAVAPRNSADL